MSRIPGPSLKEIRSRVASPVIVKTKKGKLQEIFEQMKKFELTEFVDADRGSFLDRDGILRDGGVLNDVKDSIPFYEKKLFSRFNSFSAYLPREIIFDFADRKNVDKIFYDKPMHAFVKSYEHNDTKFTTTAETKKIIGADTANDKGYTGTGENAVVIDTGGSRTHEQNRRMDFDTAMKGQHTDKNGHGQWCASCIGGVRGKDEKLSRRINKSVECEGMAPNCGLVGIKALGFVVGTGSTSGIIRAMEMSMEKYNPSVISMSLGGKSKEDKPEDSAMHHVIQDIKQDERKPILSVASGNAGPDENTVGSPGAHPGVLTVGAYNPLTSELADFSSRGPTNWGDTKPDCIAPGVNIHSGTTGYLDGAGDHMKNRYTPLSGTSMATPHISGLLTLMREAYNNVVGKTLTTKEVKRMLKEFGHTKDNQTGWGVLDWDMFTTWMQTEHGRSI